MKLQRDNIKLILSFFTNIGLLYKLETVGKPSFLPGIKIEKGCLLIDTDRLLYPGDLLHEAGHLACMPPEIRQVMDGELENVDLHRGGEMMSLAWSYAACVHLKLDPTVVFHEDGYKGESRSIINNFNSGSYIGVPLLVWSGMCNHSNETNGYPQMKTWICLDRPE